MAKKTITMVHGIRPALIRNSLVLKMLRANPEINVVFIWSGQHYSTNLKDIFFSELGITPPEIELQCSGKTDAELVGNIIKKLYKVLQDIKPIACTFLGDTNTAMGCIAAAQANIPIVHIEGCMRSYDWRMPEEKYRTAIDHLSDVIYTYFDEYKHQGILEGLNPNNIVVVQNPIVDVINEFYFKQKKKYDELATESFFFSRNLKKNEYYVMTCHRRENVHIKKTMKNIVTLVEMSDRKIYFPASYRTQQALKEYQFQLPPNVIMADPIGYKEMLLLMTNSHGVITDSGTLVEETAVLGIPSLQIRKATERPQVYDCKSSVKFDPTQPGNYPYHEVLHKLEKLWNTQWEHNLGDGHASKRIVSDIISRYLSDSFDGHKPNNYHLNINRSYRDDGI